MSSTMLDSAILFACKKHSGTFDKGGNPYILHCLKVCYYLKTDDHELMCAAVLHDVIEDTDATYQDLKDIGMSDRVIDCVRRLTKVPGETHQEYLNKVMESSDSMRVKMADLRHNSDIRRLKGVTEKDIQRVVKYQKMYQTIKEKLDGLNR